MKKQQFTRKLFTCTVPQRFKRSVCSEYPLASNGFYKSRLYYLPSIYSGTYFENGTIFCCAMLSCVSQPVQLIVERFVAITAIRYGFLWYVIFHSFRRRAIVLLQSLPKCTTNCCAPIHSFRFCCQ